MMWCQIGGNLVKLCRLVGRPLNLQPCQLSQWPALTSHHWAMHSTYSYSKLLRGRGSFTQLIRIWEFQTHTVCVFCVKYFHISSLPCILGMYTAERMDAHESSWWESWRLRASFRDEGMDCTMYIPSDRFSLTLTEELSWIKPDTPLLLAVNIIFNTLIGCQTEKLRIEICLLLAAAPFGIGGSLRLEGDSRMNKW